MRFSYYIVKINNGERRYLNIIDISEVHDSNLRNWASDERFILFCREVNGTLDNNYTLTTRNIGLHIERRREERARQALETTEPINPPTEIRDPLDDVFVGSINPDTPITEQPEPRRIRNAYNVGSWQFIDSFNVSSGSVENITVQSINIGYPSKKSKDFEMYIINK